MRALPDCALAHAPGGALAHVLAGAFAWTIRAGAGHDLVA
jgi:hypothetical protein